MPPAMVCVGHEVTSYLKSPCSILDSHSARISESRRDWWKKLTESDDVLSSCGPEPYPRALSDEVSRDVAWSELSSGVRMSSNDPNDLTRASFVSI